jgi:hypothetical protein
VFTWVALTSTGALQVLQALPAIAMHLVWFMRFVDVWT